MPVPVALIAGVAVSALASAVSGAMGASAQAEAYETLARATEAERREFQKAYDKAFGEGSYNHQMQSIGAKAAQSYYDIVNDPATWDRYVEGERSYAAPEKFSFTAQDLWDDPSYKTRLKEGLDSLGQSNVVNGLNLSGAALKATNDYAQEQASKEFGNAYDRAFRRYVDDRNSDYNAWKSQADQYYANLQKKMEGLGLISQQGVNANTAQAQALDALANRNASAIQQQATAQGAAGMANTQVGTSILDALSKGINMGMGLYASSNGATPTSTTAATPTPINTTPAAQYTLGQGLENGGQDFAGLFLNGWNPAVQTPSTGNLINMGA